METALKTLKDLWGVVEDTELHDWVSVQKLKAEAVKWWKNKRDNFETFTGTDWAKFFNLTSENLK